MPHLHQKMKHLSNSDNMLNNMSLGLITMGQLKKRCHLHWIARNIQDKPIQRPAQGQLLPSDSLEFLEREKTDNDLTETGHEKDILSKISIKNLINLFFDKYSFSFGII